MSEHEKFVCHRCFEDPGLVEFIKENAESANCSYCPNVGREPIAASIDDVSAHFTECLFQEYSRAVDEMGRVDGEWFGQFWYADELATDVLGLQFPQGNEDQLLPDLFGEHYEQDWCEADPYGLNNRERAECSWTYFREVVMHRRRFFFLLDKGDPHEQSAFDPGEVLQKIFEYAEFSGRFVKLPSGTTLRRARYEEQEGTWKTPEELGPPPVAKANQSNRMSPAGIPMFYGCDDEETALKETATGPGYFAVGEFETLRPAVLLDLSNIPPTPSLFQTVADSAEIWPREAIMFLRHVAHEMSRPIERTDGAHVGYVPTQVVAEYIRDRVTWEGYRLDGIKYFSVANPGHVSYVLFADQDDIQSSTEDHQHWAPWLELVRVEHHQVVLSTHLRASPLDFIVNAKQEQSSDAEF